LWCGAAPWKKKKYAKSENFLDGIGNSDDRTYKQAPRIVACCDGLTDLQ